MSKSQKFELENGSPQENEKTNAAELPDNVLEKISAGGIIWGNKRCPKCGQPTAWLKKGGGYVCRTCGLES